MHLIIRCLLLAIALPVLFITQSCTMKKPVDTIIFNANIYTLDEAKPGADALVVDRGKVVEAG